MLLLHPSADWYGADRQLLTLATGLDPARYRPLVVLPERGQLGVALEEAGVEVMVAPMAVLQREMVRGRRLAASAATLVRSRRELLRIVRDRRIPLVHTNTSILLGGQGVARAGGARHLLHVREIYSDGAGPSGLWPLLRRSLRRADRIACVSEAAAAPLGRSPHIVVIPDGVPRVVERMPKAVARAALGIEPGTFVVATIGRISDWKGQHVLVRALAHPDLMDVGAVGILAGEAAPGQEHFRDRLGALQDSLNLNGRLRLLGFQGDLSEVLGAADAVAVPSIHPDALPNAALEAAAAGLPVVGTTGGGQPEIFRDGVTGRLVPPGDHVALAGALRELAERPDWGARMGAAAATDVEARFSRRRMLDAVQAQYDVLLA